MPQPLTYLVDDAARTFGTVRVGHAEAFLRADDEAALTELLHHPRAGSLGLRRLAPTVLVSTTPLDVLHPAAARARGVAAGGEHRRHRPREPPRPARARPSAGRRGVPADARLEARLAQVVTAIRAGDKVAATRGTAGAATHADPDRLAGGAARRRRVRGAPC